MLEVEREGWTRFERVSCIDICDIFMGIHVEYIIGDKNATAGAWGGAEPRRHPF